MLTKQTNLKLPRLISDGMILQRNTQIRIWGWAAANDKITVSFQNMNYCAQADGKGEWQAWLQTENAGGPYEMIIEDATLPQTIRIKDIFLGDVWVCSGQSNMEMKMYAVREKYEKEIAESANTLIRQFLVPVKYDFEKPQTDFDSGSWVSVSPVSILDFSAAGYFFAAQLYERYHIPVGLIHASLGGSPAQAWLSEEAIAKFPDYQEAVNKMKNSDFVDAILKDNQEKYEKWHGLVDESDIGNTKSRKPGKPFFSPDYDATGWQEINLPCFWEEEGLGYFNGAVWFRKDFEIASFQQEGLAGLVFGNIIDEDTTYINGIKIGETPMQYIPRRYHIPKGILREGKNTIVIRVINLSGDGGFYQDKPYFLKIGEETIDLSGSWQYRIGVKSDPLPTPFFVMWQPCGLYNGMIAPIIRYAVKGAIWYQGETNAQHPEDYEHLFQSLIIDWRKKWEECDFPFIYVQLPNFQEPLHSPAAGKWPMIREAQRKALSVPSTAMAVTIDLGEKYDVHPVKKKEVGKRLALAAQKLAYGDVEQLTSGPVLCAAQREGHTIRLSFHESGSGLKFIEQDGSSLFEISGSNQVFVRAEYKIDADSIIVWKKEICDPASVRYAWADNPEGAVLYNLEGLPASPFFISL